MENTRRIKIFLSSSSHLEEERNIIVSLVNTKNNKWKNNGISVELSTWEKLDASKDIFSEINNYIIASDIFILLTDGGTGQYKREFESALKQYESTKKPLIIVVSSNLNSGIESLKSTSEIFEYSESSIINIKYNDINDLESNLISKLEPIIFNDSIGSFDNPDITQVINQDKEADEKAEKYWLLKINGVNWRVGDFTIGYNAYFHSNHSPDGQGEDYDYFKSIKKGDKVLCYSYNSYNSIICIFDVIHPLHIDPNLGEIISLKILELFNPILNFNYFNSKISFAPQLDSSSFQKLFPLSEEVYKNLISLENERKSNLKSEPDIKSRLISDAPNLDEADVLGYDLIADNLFNILIDEATNPPLNIGIMAPWGRGKTTLMKRIQRKFDDERKKILKKRTSEAEKNKVVKVIPQLKVLNDWLKSDSLGVNYNLPFTTVWFNPWNYQSSDMIWAGLANAVIEQVVEQIPDKIDRETFWLQLNIARIDKDELRRDLQIRAVLYCSQFFIWIIAALIGIVYFLFGEHSTATGVFGISTFVLGAITSIGSFLKPYAKSISETFDKYSKKPQYTKNLGSFHEVQADLNRVLDLCIDDKKPLVIFVDDLDRCSPSKVVEVIEAINVFINGKYNNKCYFILGMDAEMVAAALDVSYDKMKGRIGSKEIEQGSIGWYFLDKFIQLPFFIPVMSEGKKKEYLKDLLSEKETANIEAAKPNEKQIDDLKVNATFNSIINNNNATETKRIIDGSNLSSIEKAELNKKILKHQVDSKEQNEKIKTEVSRYANYLNSDPRSLKRFANMLRFYCSYQFVRMKNGQPYVEADILSKWLALMVKFPQMIRWIQWDSENKSGLNSTAESKAKLMDDLFYDFLKENQNKDAEESFKTWQQVQLPNGFYQDGDIIKIANLKELTWLNSRSMFRIMSSQTSDNAKFSNALDCNVW